MSQFDYFAILAIILTMARYGIYFHTIYQGKTNPHAFSWLIWGVVAGIGALAQFDLNSGPSALALAFIASACLIVSALSFFIGDRDFTGSDWGALIASGVALLIWQITQNPLAAILIVIVINIISYWPTIRKAHIKPQSEPPISYGIAGVRYLLILLAIPEPTWQNTLYPITLTVISFGFVFHNILRRAQLGCPLHEYAKVRVKRKDSN